MPRQPRYTSLTHLLVEELLAEAFGETMTAQEEDERFHWWLIANRCLLELQRRHTIERRNQCPDKTCGWWYDNR